jgi:predicted nuclease with TOPRIM domain
MEGEVAELKERLKEIRKENRKVSAENRRMLAEIQRFGTGIKEMAEQKVADQKAFETRMKTQAVEIEVAGKQRVMQRREHRKQLMMEARAKAASNNKLNLGIRRLEVEIERARQMFEAFPDRFKQPDKPKKAKSGRTTKSTLSPS